MGAFEEFCSQLGEVPPHVKIGRRYFYDPRGLLALAQARNWDVFSVGLYLGEERRGFQPTSALIDLLGKESPRQVTVGEKAAWLFLCGRDVLMAGVTMPGEFNRDDVVFVADWQGNILGYGRIMGRYDSKMRNKTYVKHVLDKGEYLRRER